MCIGLGAGYLANLFKRFYPDAIIDVVEIDEKVYEVAFKHFNFKPDNKLNIHIDDALAFVEKASTNDYNLIALDAYDQNHKIPPHLNTTYFFKHINRILGKGGIVSANLHGRFKGKYSENFIQTYTKINLLFPESVLIPSPNEWEMNILTISSYEINKGKNEILELFDKLPVDYLNLIKPWIDVKFYRENDLETNTLV